MAKRTPAKRTPARRTPALDLAVVGGGIIGLACAWAAARRGLRVEVLERGPLPGDQPDSALANAQAATWASAGMLAPLAEIPTPGPFFDICRRSREAWPAWVAALGEAAGYEIDYATDGTVLLETPDQSAAPSSFLQQMRQAAEAANEPHLPWDRPTLTAAIPDLAPDLASALFLPQEHRVDNREVAQALVVAAENAGAQIVGDSPVVWIAPRVGAYEVTTESRQVVARQVLLTAGAWTQQIAGVPPLGLRPIRGQMVMLGQVDWPFHGAVRGEHFYAVRRRGGRLLIGATVEDVGFAATTTPHGLGSLLGWAERIFPGLAHHPILESWAGLRPATPDHLPILGELQKNLWVASGHFRNGILLAPWTARVVAGMLAGDPRELDELDQQALALFAPRSVP